MKNRRVFLIAGIAVALAVLAAVVWGTTVKKPTANAPEAAPEAVTYVEPATVDSVSNESGEYLQISYEPVSDNGFPELDVPSNAVLKELTASGKVVPSIMSAEIISSNPREIMYLTGEADHYTVYGPNIVINGFAVPSGDFYAYRASDLSEKGRYVTYYLRCDALKKCGLSQILQNTNAPCVDGYLDLKGETASFYEVPLTDIELDVTFTLLDYDEASNTYYFTAENNGPYSGTSDYFFMYFNHQERRCFPTDLFGIPESAVANVSISKRLNFVAHSDHNDYWSRYNVTRNEARRLFNEAYGTNYEPLDYEQDDFLHDNDYLAAIESETFRIEQRDLQQMKEWYLENPDELEAWKAEHPGEESPWAGKLVETN